MRSYNKKAWSAMLKKMNGKNAGAYLSSLPNAKVLRLLIEVAPGETEEYTHRDAIKRRKPPAPVGKERKDG